jgi:hypothetical protein
MMIYISGMDIYTMSMAFSEDPELKKAVRSYRRSVRKVGLLFSYHFLYANRPIDLQFLTWEAMFKGGELKFKKVKTKDENETSKTKLIEGPECGKVGFGFKGNY